MFLATPFSLLIIPPESARVYLEEACKNLDDKVNELLRDADSLALPAGYRTDGYPTQKSKYSRRYKEALHTLSQDDSIIISQADKVGGVIVMNKIDYLDKILDLLNDYTTYERKPDGNADNEAEKFKIEARNILRKSGKGKKLIGLLEEAPRPPLMHGLPKVHKTGIPMRPITSGIGSAPHKLAKRLAKPLSGTLGSISDAHLRNSSDLIRRLNDLYFYGKKLASYDVKALFTNVDVEEALVAAKKVIDNLSNDELQIPRNDYIKLISLCESELESADEPISSLEFGTVTP
ncbi:uncharacterized protein LOC143034772 [Oratosquilla oratoria]|uniref:uncharacterized protein LOC143034772 n=1 Tax=Oratosquilla oratoria TaxID=337810 RepID=UPI003F7781BF